MSRQIDRIVFDAEPLIAHADDEHGSRRVDEILDEVAVGNIEGFLCEVNFVEVRYVLARKYDLDTADSYLKGIASDNLYNPEIEEIGKLVSRFKLEYNPALGDAFALATASALSATLLVGADDDYDGIDEVDIERFRTTPSLDLLTELTESLSEGDIITLAGISHAGEETAWRFDERRSGTVNGNECEMFVFTQFPNHDGEPMSIQVSASSPKQIDAIFAPVAGRRQKIDPDDVELTGLNPQHP